MERDPAYGKVFSEASKTLAFIPVAVAIYLFILERLSEGIFIEYDPYVMSFVSFAVVVSSLYVVFGYLSRSENGELIPAAFLIFASLSFSVGSAFSILILEFVKAIKPVLPTHWVFLCIWTLFMAGAIFSVSNDISGLSRGIRGILAFFGVSWLVTGNRQRDDGSL
jgi:hypothetical protein